MSILFCIFAVIKENNNCQPSTSSVKSNVMKLRVSEYNELHFSEVQAHVKVVGNLKKSPNANGRFLGLVKLGIGNRISEYSVYSDDEVIINNVRFCLAFAPDDYFNKFVEIN